MLRFLGCDLPVKAQRPTVKYLRPVNQVSVRKRRYSMARSLSSSLAQLIVNILAIPNMRKPKPAVLFILATKPSSLILRPGAMAKLVARHLLLAVARHRTTMVCHINIRTILPASDL